MDLFQPSYLALVQAQGTICEYYLNEQNELSLIEEAASFQLVHGQIQNYPLPHSVKIKQIYNTSIKISCEPFVQQIHINFDTHSIVLENLYRKGGEAIIYKGTLDGRSVVFKMYTRFGKKLRALPVKIHKYLPQKYLLFKEGAGRYVIAMEKLEEPRWSQQLYHQSLEFLKLHVLHGDISPGNVMQDTEGNLKLIDFLRIGIMKGTPFYASGNTDQQALGRVLLSLKYQPLMKTFLSNLGVSCKRCSLSKLYRVFAGTHSIPEFLQWFQQNFEQDQISRDLIQMAL